MASSDIPCPPAQIESTCQQCHVQSKNSKICSRCKAVVYCGRDCQKAAFRRHKTNCKIVEAAREKMENEEGLLLASKPNLWRDIDNMGHFWGLVRPRPYCRARKVHAIKLMKLGQAETNFLAFKKALDEFLELHRLSHGDNQGVRAYIPFLLLILDRSQDCYDFIKWYMTRGDTYDWGDPPMLSQGQWQYLNGENSLEKLPFDMVVNQDVEFVLALAVLKCGYVRTLIQGRDIPAIDFYADLSEKEKLLPKASIDKLINSRREDVIEKQTDIIMQHLRVIHEGLNKILLLAYINPAPIMAKPYPKTRSWGCSDEARFLMEFRWFIIQLGALPVFKEFVKEFYGSNFDYDPDWQDEHCVIKGGIKFCRSLDDDGEQSKVMDDHMREMQDLVEAKGLFEAIRIMNEKTEKNLRDFKRT